MRGFSSISLPRAGRRTNRSRAKPQRREVKQILNHRGLRGSQRETNRLFIEKRFFSMNTAPSSFGAYESHTEPLSHGEFYINWPQTHTDGHRLLKKNEPQRTQRNAVKSGGYMFTEKVFFQ